MNESTIGGVSIRAILVFSLLTIFATTLFIGKNSEVLNAITTAAIGWYFGQKATESKE
jgi:hypothetical protein